MVEFSTDLGDYDDRVSPVNHKRQVGGHYEDEYQYREVIHDFDPDTVFPDKAEVVKRDGMFFYRWPGEKPVVVVGDEVYHQGESDTERMEKQAYHCLSMLESEGYVTGWRKL